MISFDYNPRTRVVFGAGRLAELGALAREIGARRALIVSDPGIVAAGHTAGGLESLAAAGVDTQLFSDIGENPTTEHVDAGVAAARRYQPDLIVGLGGGSSMDAAKGINFVYSCGGRMQDYWGVGKATRDMLPMIAVPTTAGTGSETQSFALITDADTHVKMACGDKRATCRVALLDPQLTITQPRRVTALTGIDAVAHALETYVTKPRNPVSTAFSREAWRLLSENFERVLDDPDNIEARGGMQLGACFAGLAIENSMLGATHALANPLTARYKIAHGQAIALMLPHVVRFNAAEVGRLYRELLESTPMNGKPRPVPIADDLAHTLAAMVSHAGLACRLADCGVEREKLAELAALAAREWTGGFNPRSVSEADLLELYRAAY